MKKKIICGLLATLPAMAFAQSAIDGYNISGDDLRGTARFMSMAGAFTALGGDLSTLNQNPGGIGIYRSSEIGITGAVDAMSFKSEADGFTNTFKKTRGNLNNIGYVGTVRLNSEAMPFFNWGVSYACRADFERHYGGMLTDNLQTSLMNYVADYTTYDGYTPAELGKGKDYDPYMESQAPWMSILAFNGYGINPTAPGANSYVGLYNYDRTDPGSAYYQITEKGHVDEYSINFGGNIYNTVYWGIGFGITELDFKQTAYYEESFKNADVASADATTYTNGNGEYGLVNRKHVWGSGFNIKAGVIIKPINEFRIGLAVHTPTWYNLSYSGDGYMDYSYTSPDYPDGERISGLHGTDYDDFDWDFQTPWRLMAGVAGVIGGRGIISLDYEYKAYQDMKIKDWNGNSYDMINSDVETYYRGTNTVRVGAEFRATPNFSIRAGYSYESSPVKEELLDPTGNTALAVYTSGPDDTETQPSYTFNRETQHITLGLGYRYKAFSADLAYVHRIRKADYHAFTDYNENFEPYYLVTAPQAQITDINNSFVLSLSYRF